MCNVSVIISCCVVVACLLLGYNSAAATTLRIMMLLVVIVLLISCGGVKYIPINRVQYITERLRDTVVEVVTPAERVEGVVAADTVSRLSTTYATSVAEVRSGMLYHRLEQPPRRDSATVQTAVIQVIDSVPYPVRVEVEKRVIPRWSWCTLAGCVVLVCMILRRITINKE